ncbi:hypothetical protein [Streptomyces hydrogenans]|uniref:hypothetical protein n=1 Tax=Streptomyces hydrogenans TaxID=1873719 RepID=UPI0035DBA743
MTKPLPYLEVRPITQRDLPTAYLLTRPAYRAGDSLIPQRAMALTHHQARALVLDLARHVGLLAYDPALLGEVSE